MAQKRNEQNILFLYEPTQADACVRYLDEHPQVRERYIVIALGLQVEYALAGKGIPFHSGRAYRPKDISRFLLAEEWTARMFDGKEWDWFRYRGVSLSQTFYTNIRDYFLRLLYYATILENVLVQHPAARRLIVFPSPHSLATAPKAAPARGQQPLLREQIVAVVACARLIGKERGVDVVVPQAPARAERARAAIIVFALKRIALEAMITFYNAGIALLRPRGTPRIFASDYWRNVAPILSQIPRGELMLFDRSEAFKAGIKNLWRFRIRLYNFNSFSVRGRRKAREETIRLFAKQWSTLRAHGLPEFGSGGFSLRPLVMEALEELYLRVAPQALRDIDGAYALLERRAPDIVFLRASISLQTHFNLLAQVARACGIPSLELQHGLEDLGSHSYTKRHAAEYIAVYGRAIQDEFTALGLPRDNIPIIGSPRFDGYKKEIAAMPRNGPRRNGLTILCVGTFVAVESAQDEYDMEDYYRAIARALENIPGSAVVIKLRPGPTHEQFYRALIDEVFARVPHTVVQYESLPELFASADAVVSYYSTFVLESLQFGKPTVVYSGEPREEAMTRHHFTQYEKAGAVLTSYSQSELEKAFRSLASDVALRVRLAKGAEKVLAQLHSFDGSASARIKELIERLAQKGRGRASS